MFVVVVVVVVLVVVVRGGVDVGVDVVDVAVVVAVAVVVVVVVVDPRLPGCGLGSGPAICWVGAVVVAAAAVRCGLSLRLSVVSGCCCSRYCCWCCSLLLMLLLVVCSVVVVPVVVVGARRSLLLWVLVYAIGPSRCGLLWWYRCCLWAGIVCELLRWRPSLSLLKPAVGALAIVVVVARLLFTSLLVLLLLLLLLSLVLVHAEVAVVACSLRLLLSECSLACTC